MTATNEKTAPQTTTAKPEAAPANDNRPALTRVPVRILFFYSNEHQDLPGGHGQVSNVKCWREPAHTPRWFTCDFLPAWQTFELHYHLEGKESEIVNIPVGAVKKWIRE